jgi:hypothetical protein
MTKEQIERGIAAYARERTAFKRLLRKCGKFTEQDFDGWFYNRRSRRRRCNARFYAPDTFILGVDRYGHSLRNEMLELLQVMVRLGEVTTATEDGLVVYRRAS